MAVDRRAAHAELGPDLRDGVCLSPVVSNLLVHLPRKLDLPWSELGPLPSGPAARPGGRQAVHRALRHQRVLEFRDRADDLKEQSAHSGRGVDPLVEHDEVDAAFMELLRGLDQMLERAAEPVKLRDHELVAGAVSAPQRLVQVGSSGQLPEAVSTKI
jgi:hypothetical protein